MANKVWRFGKIRQIRQTFLPPTFCPIRYKPHFIEIPIEDQLKVLFNRMDIKIALITGFYAAKQIQIQLKIYMTVLGTRHTCNQEDFYRNKVTFL